MGGDCVEATLKDAPLAYATWAKLYKQDIIGETRFQQGIRINEDSLFVFEILCKRPIFVGINEKIYDYRINDNSASHAAFSEKFFDIMKVSQIKYDIIRSQFPDCLNLAENMKIKAQMNLLQILATRTKGEYHSMEKMLRNIHKNRKYYMPAKESDNKWMRVLDCRMYGGICIHKKDATKIKNGESIYFGESCSRAVLIRDKM